MINAIKLYITKGAIEDYQLFLERLEKSGLSWRSSDPKDADAIIVLAGLWKAKREELMGAVNIALKSSKPIITVRPYGLENVPPELEAVSSEIVGWNPHCIRDAVEDALDDSIQLEN